MDHSVRLRPATPADAAVIAAFNAAMALETEHKRLDPAMLRAGVERAIQQPEAARYFLAEIDGQVAGGIQYHEENDPMYRHAGIDIYLAARFQGRGLGREAVRLLAGFLFERRGHHRITIDPAAANDQAISSYAKVGFRAVGVMRQYERGTDGRFHDGLQMDLLRGELAEDR